ncbi:MAG: hypothetical protein IPJ81_08350 [Chitinophagaceae bacterium]|nr:hypothetical protein [Chitinophagaceae bacterium]
MAVYAATKKVKEGCPPPFLPTSFSMWQLAQSSVFCRNLSDVGCAASPQNQCLLNTPKLPSANINGCNTDWDMAWKNFRSLYLTERKKIISQYLLDACSQKNDDVIKDEKYQLRFIDYNNIDYNKLDDDNNDLNTFFDQLGKGDELAINTAKELAAEQYDATCKGYADSWIAQLEQCPSIGAISKDDSTWLVTRLVQICTTGSDENHYLGSSSIKPGDDPINDKGNLYTQFPDVIKLFLQNKGIAIEALCHPYLITAPAPYDKQAAVTDQQVITKPDSCQCDRLSNLEAERVKAAYAGNLSTYLQFKYGTSITQGAIDTLFALCTGQYECIFLPAPIVLPPVLQCNTPVKTCITCEEYQQIKMIFCCF